MTPERRLTRQEMDVLADAAEVRLVILGDLGDSELVHGGEARNADARSRIAARVAVDEWCATAHSPPQARAVSTSRIMTMSTLTGGNWSTQVPGSELERDLRSGLLGRRLAGGWLVRLLRRGLG